MITLIAVIYVNQRLVCVWQRCTRVPELNLPIPDPKNLYSTFFFLNLEAQKQGELSHITEHVSQPKPEKF